MFMQEKRTSMVIDCSNGRRKYYCQQIASVRTSIGRILYSKLHTFTIDMLFRHHLSLAQVEETRNSALQLHCYTCSRQFAGDSNQNRITLQHLLTSDSTNW